jgi:short subunit fatty acids transporter
VCRGAGTGRRLAVATHCRSQANASAAAVASRTLHWKLGVALGIIFGLALVRNVLSDHATPRPHGAYYAFELIWRGGIYGAMDALLLTVLPCLVVYRALGRHLATWRRRIAYLHV